MSGCANVNPAASSFVGATRCPASSISSPIWPNAAFTAAAGSGKIAGRCKRPTERLDEVAVRDRAGSRHVDRALERVLEREEVRRDGVVERDPAPPLAAAPDPSAGAELERRQEPLERPTVAREHDPLAEVHRPQPRGPGGLGRRLPRLDDLGQEPLARAPSPRRRSRRRGRRRTRSRTRRGGPACPAARPRSPRSAACPRRGSRAPSAASPRSSAGRCSRRRGGRSRSTSCERAASIVPASMSQRASSGPAGSRRTRRTRSWPASASAVGERRADQPRRAGDRDPHRQKSIQKRDKTGAEV